MRTVEVRVSQIFPREDSDVTGDITVGDDKQRTERLAREDLYGTIKLVGMDTGSLDI